MTGPVRQLRVVVHADDHDAAVAFYRDVLGLPGRRQAHQDGEMRVVVLGRRGDPRADHRCAQEAVIDEVEVGRPVAPHGPT
jgi:catechol 2,3-dioxygenase-like lactoylglutathione lyase family enzyme